MHQQQVHVPNVQHQHQQNVQHHVPGGHVPGRLAPPHQLRKSSVMNTIRICSIFLAYLYYSYLKWFHKWSFASIDIFPNMPGREVKFKFRWIDLKNKQKHDIQN